MIVEIQAHEALTSIDNYEMLEMFGMVNKYDNGQCSLANNVVVLKEEFDKKSILPLSFLFTGHAFTCEELRKALKETDLSQYRVHLSYFYPQEDGKITQKSEYWHKFKAWRYDIDDVNYTLEQVLELVDKLPLRPNLIKKSNKGWHLLFVFDRFIERDEVDRYRNRPNDKDYTAFMTYEILTTLLPKYLKELEPKIDVSASSVISKIMTRFINDKLPAYVLNPEYSLETFINAYSFLTKRVFEYEAVYNEISNYKDNEITNYKSTFTIQDINKEEFYTALSRCGVLKALDEDWENHSYSDWFVMFNIYAVRCLFADNDKELEDIRKEFHEKSRKHPKYSYQSAEYHLNNAIKQQREGLKLPGCKYINQNVSSKYLEACKTCSYKKVDKDGNIYSHWLFSYLNQDSLEDIIIKGWELKDNGWCMYDEESGGYLQVLPYFKIRTHYLVGDDEFIELVDKRSRSYIKLVERKKDTYQVNVDLVKSFGVINPAMVKSGRAFLTSYIEQAKVKRGVKIDYVGYKSVGNDWDIVVGGYGQYTRKEISFIFHGKEIGNSDWYVPEVKGSEEVFKSVYKSLFELDDAPLHMTIAHFLSWIGREFIKDRSLISNINPILILIGDTGTGKSIRVKLATALYGNPALFSFTNITQAGFNNKFPLIKTPFGIDEVIMKRENDERKFGELVYNITNIQGKMTFNNTYNPIDVPIVITGETENLLIDKAFSSFRGLNRRSIVVEMDDRWKKNAGVLDDALDELYSHHGHILSYVKSLKEEDKKEIIDWIKSIQARLNFGDSSFKDLRKHLSLSLAMFGHFYERYIGVDAGDVVDKISGIIDFISKQIEDKQVSKIGENVNYVDEVINFINAVREALNNKKELKNFSYAKVCEKIGYTPSNRVGELLKKFFFKRYPSKLAFYPSVLLITLPEPFMVIGEVKDILKADKERLVELNNDEFTIWAKVLELQHSKENILKIVDEIKDKRLQKIFDSDKVKDKDKDEEVEF